MEPENLSILLLDGCLIFFCMALVINYCFFLLSSSTWIHSSCDISFFGNGIFIYKSIKYCVSFSPNSIIEIFRLERIILRFHSIFILIFWKIREKTMLIMIYILKNNLFTIIYQNFIQSCIKRNHIILY